MCNVFTEENLNATAQTASQAANTQFKLMSGAQLGMFGLELLQQRQKVRDIERYQRRVRDNEIANLTEDYRAISRQEQQFQERAALDLRDIAMEAANAISRQDLAGAESSTVGTSMMDVVGQTLSVAGKQQNLVQSELESILIESQFRKEQRRAQANAVIASTEQTVAGPTVAGLGMGIMNAYFDAKSNYYGLV